jgi:hypothetical protein
MQLVNGVVFSRLAGVQAILRDASKTRCKSTVSHRFSGFYHVMAEIRQGGSYPAKRLNS